MTEYLSHSRQTPWIFRTIQTTPRTQRPAHTFFPSPTVESCGTSTRQSANSWLSSAPPGIIPALLLCERTADPDHCLPQRRTLTSTLSSKYIRVEARLCPLGFWLSASPYRPSLYRSPVPLSPCHCHLATPGYSSRCLKASEPTHMSCVSTTIPRREWSVHNIYHFTWTKFTF